MAIKHTAVSYYGLNYVEHAIEDFKEMKEHGWELVNILVENKLVFSCRTTFITVKYLLIQVKF